MNQGPRRIQCPRCRANNFLGKTHCWQCSSPLPPPEAAVSAASAPAADTLQSYPSAAPPHNYRPLATRPTRAPLRLALPVGLGVAAVALTALFVSSRPNPSYRASVNEFAREQAQLEEQLRRMNRGGASRSFSPEEEQARRELRRLERQLETIAPPPAGPDGRVQLRSGGSLSREEYDRFLRNLNR